MNKKNIIFVEGIQGSGKSTLAKDIAKKIKKADADAKVFQRCEKPNPLDISRIAFFNRNELNSFLTLCNTNYEEIEPYLDNEVVQLSVNWFEFMMDKRIVNPIARDYALEHEICDGRLNADDFMTKVKERWRAFANHSYHNEYGYFIFEGTLYQHLLAELIGYYLLSDSEIISFFSELSEIIVEFNPILYYIIPNDCFKVIISAMKERVSNDYNWSDGIQKWISNCNYGRINGLQGIDGIIKYCNERIRIEKLLIDSLPIKYKLIKRSV